MDLDFLTDRRVVRDIKGLTQHVEDQGSKDDDLEEDDWSSRRLVGVGLKSLLGGGVKGDLEDQSTHM